MERSKLGIHTYTRGLRWFIYRSRQYGIRDALHWVTVKYLITIASKLTKLAYHILNFVDRW